jgi:NO-binding membrane sensor protein with MHYT domain
MPQHDVLVHSHNPVLVGLSVIIAILASYTALDLAGRVSARLSRVASGDSQNRILEPRP